MTQNASTYYTTVSRGTYIFLQSLYIPIGIFGIISNGLVLIAYAKYKQFRQIECAHLILALSVADFICGFGNVIQGASRLEIALFDDYGNLWQPILLTFLMKLISTFYFLFECFSIFVPRLVEITFVFCRS